MPIVWLVFDRSIQPPVPEGLVDVDELAAEFDSDPKMRPLMEQARREIAERYYSEETSLAFLRLKRGWSQAKLAAEAHTSQSHIARIESGVADPQLATVMRLAHCLDIGVGKLAEILARGRDEP